LFEENVVSGEVICVSASRAILGENPLWDEKAGCLFFIDCMGRKLLRHDRGQHLDQEWPLRRVPGSLALRLGGGLLLANRQGLAFASPGSDVLQDIPSPDVDFSKEIFNDGKCDKRGRFWVGTMDRNVKEPVGGLFRLDLDGSLLRMDSGITLANGIAWSPDDRTMYFCDSRPGRIWAYDYDLDRGEIANRRLFVDFTNRQGRPDGCTVDAEGGLWVAEIGAGQLVCFDATGREASTVKLPVSKPTSVTFGGADLRTMFVTSMRHGLSEEGLAAEPLAGGVFVVDVDVAGLPAMRFGG
jgi:sugar lactone lactonase YvrE